MTIQPIKKINDVKFHLQKIQYNHIQLIEWNDSTLSNTMIWRKELLYALIVMLMPFSFGCIIGYPSPVIPEFRVLWNITEFQSTSFNAISSLTAMCGPFIATKMLDSMGRRVVSFIFGVFSLLLWVLLNFINEDRFSFGILIRGCQGLCMGAFSSIGPMYLVELAPNELSGFFGNLNQLGIISGIVVLYIIGAYNTWWVLNVMGIIVSTLLCSFIWFVPETGNIDEKNELVLQESICDEKFHSKLVMCIILMMFQQFCGTNGILTNLSSIFSNAQIPINPGLASAIVVGAQIISCVVSGSLVDQLGRKILWCISGTSVSISLIIYGLNSLFNWSKWIPVIIVFIYMLAFSLALGPVPWYIVSELFPSSIRSMASSINSMTSFSGSFIIILIYPILSNSITEAGAMFVFAFMSGLSVIYGYLYITEPSQEKNSIDEEDVLPSEI